LMLAIGAWLMEFRYLSWSSLTDLQVQILEYFGG
jgi:hypothetical protein